MTTAVARHHNLLWWLHSAYALLFGIGVMWLGARRYDYLRLAVVYVGVIWLTSFLMPSLARAPRLSPRWRERVRIAVNYFHRNFYQQLLFFLLPIYYASVTLGSLNGVFLVFLAASALISTLDVVYDRHLSVRRGLLALFLAFNLFACINVMLPVVWRISNASALPLSAALALLAFVTLWWRRETASGDRRWVVPLLAGVVLFAVATWGQPFIPPAPLQLADAGFGLGLDRSQLRLTSPVTTIASGWSGPLYALTAISAPLGLEDQVAHRWYENGRLVYASPFYRLVGGRPEGYRLWTRRTIGRLAAGAVIRLDVETEAGQLIGRVTMAVRQGNQPDQ